MVTEVESGQAGRERIMTEAARLFAERGSRATSVSDVISRAGISKGAFYHHFASKEELVLAVFDRKDQLWFSVGQKAMEVEDPLERVLAMVRVGVEAYEADPEPRCFIRLTMELTDTEAGRERVIPPLERYIGYLGEVLREAQERSTVRADIDVDAVASSIAGGFMGIEGVSYQLTGGADFRQRIKGWLDLLLRAIRTEKEGTDG